MDDRNKGFIQGVAWALTEIMEYNHGIAEYVLSASGIPFSDFRKVGVDERDRKRLRKISKTRRDYYK